MMSVREGFGASFPVDERFVISAEEFKGCDGVSPRFLGAWHHPIFSPLLPLGAGLSSCCPSLND